MGLEIAHNKYIKGDIFLKEKSKLMIGYSGQMSRTSNIELDSSIIEIRTEGNTWILDTVTNIINNLTVKGDSLLAFNWRTGYSDLYLNDLLITEGSLLRIQRWNSNRERHRLLVRKDSEHLEESLKRIKFEGIDEPMGSVRDFDKDYWEIIPGMPEPAAYGAILGATGLGLWALKKRSKVRRKASR